jgi:hypothetical protein
MYAILKEHQRRPPGSLKSLFRFLSFPQEAVFWLLVWPLDLSFQIFAAGHVYVCCKQMLKIAMDALVTGFYCSSSVTIINLLHQQRSCGMSRPKPPIIYPRHAGSRKIHFSSLAKQREQGSGTGRHFMRLALVLSCLSS